MFRKIVKRILEVIARPLVRYYLKKPRHFKYKGLKMIVFPGVFHPLLFFSSTYLGNFICNLKLKDSTFLDLGSGSGLLTLLAARSGAKVTAVDLSALAVANTSGNAHLNNLDIITIESDLFENLPVYVYDYIVINPPFYPSDPVNDSDLAWYCGSGYEYFGKLFAQLSHYYDENSQVYMILSEDCAINTIKDIAAQNSHDLRLVSSKRTVVERNFIFRILQKADS
jgi:release factor glutamine methyltransferase